MKRPGRISLAEALAVIRDAIERPWPDQRRYELALGPPPCWLAEGRCHER